jgi:hypothetical protein
VIGNWIDQLRAQGVDETSCHHVREIRPGGTNGVTPPIAPNAAQAAQRAALARRLSATGWLPGICVPAAQRPAG